MSTVIGWFLVTCPDQIQMCPNRDIIVQLLPVRRFCLFDFAVWKSKYITKHLMYGPSGN